MPSSSSLTPRFPIRARVPWAGHILAPDGQVVAIGVMSVVVIKLGGSGCEHSCEGGRGRGHSITLLNSNGPYTNYTSFESDRSHVYNIGNELHSQTNQKGLASLEILIQYTEGARGDVHSIRRFHLHLLVPMF